ncbi:HAD family hydrolase [Mesorhizobium sp. ES1-1]|uniref:HAD family hydrolase n=1 Tax=Mesorhizobium sp. ES1-1 TaxID=2876629 RepID=UPI001CCEB5FC|nr:HAD family hydrolase [Mesorhizobium sp. ES1-1]
MHVAAILFDIDGTLVDSNDLHVLAWEEAFLGAGKRFERQVIHDQIGKGADMLVPTLMPEADAETRKELGEAQGKIFRDKFLHQVKPFPAAHEILAHAHGLGQRVALASSASEEDLAHHLDLLKARDIVAATTSSADVARTKPAPDIFSTALAKLPGVSPRQTVVVGDTPYDVEAARKIGISTIALRSGGFTDELLGKAGAIAIYDDVAALLADYDNSPLGRVNNAREL